MDVTTIFNKLIGIAGLVIFIIAIIYIVKFIYKRQLKNALDRIPKKCPKCNSSEYKCIESDMIAGHNDVSWVISKFHCESCGYTSDYFISQSKIGGKITECEAVSEREKMRKVT